MNIFTDKELQVIQLMVPDMTPEEACNKVLRDWFTSNLARLQQTLPTQDEILDNVIATHLENEKKPK